MTLIVRAAPRTDWQWLVDRTGCAITSDFSALEAIELHPRTEGLYRVRGIVGYCNTTPNTIQMHMAVDSPVVWRSLLRPGLEYPFLQAGKRICVGVIPASNRRSVRFAKHVGFVETHRIFNGWADGEDLVFLELRREHCRFLRGGAGALRGAGTKRPVPASPHPKQDEARA